jgi:hypothetical protein
MDLGGDNGGAPSGSPFDEILRRGPEVVLVPTVGMIVPGYLMAVTTTHRHNFGQLGAATLRTEVQPWLSQQLADLAAIFGEDYVVFEHGSASEAERYGGCVVHAHLHLVPGGSELGELLLGPGDWDEIQRLEDLAGFANSGYAFLAFGGRKWAMSKPSFAGQWVRREIACWAGVPDEWDWQLFRGEKNLDVTLRSLRGAAGDRRNPSST